MWAAAPCNWSGPLGDCHRHIHHYWHHCDHHQHEWTPCVIIIIIVIIIVVIIIVTHIMFECHLERECVTCREDFRRPPTILTFYDQFHLRKERLSQLNNDLDLPFSQWTMACYGDARIWKCRMQFWEPFLTLTTEWNTFWHFVESESVNCTSWKSKEECPCISVGGLSD